MLRAGPRRLSHRADRAGLTIARRPRHRPSPLVALEHQGGTAGVAAFTLASVGRLRREERRARHADSRSSVLRVDGREAPCLVLDQEQAWAVVAHAGRLTITVTAVGVALEEIELVTVTDREAYLGEGP